MQPGELCSRNRRPVLEPLEPRLLLDGLAGQQALQLFNASPALFAQNQGQWADVAIRYVHNGAAASVAMTDAGVIFRLFRQEADDASEVAEWATSPGPGPAEGLPGLDDRAVQAIQLSVSFVGANTVPPVGLEQAETYFNYFIGEQANWRQKVPTYEVVAYQGLYEGIELLTFGLRSHLKYEFHVAPGADYQQIQVRYEGIESLSLAADGSLRIQTALGELADDAPYIYQVIDGQTVQIGGEFVLLDEFSYGFAVTGGYDPTVELVIDPDLAWGSFLGGSDWDEGWEIAADGAGNAFLTGYTDSSDFPTPGGFDGTLGGGCDAFVAKVTPTGLLAWGSFLGGSDDDYGEGIAADAAGNVLLTGRTFSSDFPTPGGFDTNLGGEGDAFVAKVSPTGSLAWGSFLGGSGGDSGYGIAADAAGNALLTGYTCSGTSPPPEASTPASAAAATPSWPRSPRPVRWPGRASWAAPAPRMAMPSRPTARATPC